MKKIFDFLKSPLVISIMVIGGVYLFWLFTTTTDIRSIHSVLNNFGSYIAALAIFGIYLFIIAIKHRGKKFFKLDYIAVAILFIVYVRWFQLIPTAFEDDEFTSPSYIAGIILFGICVIFLASAQLAKNHPILRTLLLVPAILIFCLNLIFTWIFFPTLSINTRCNGTTYYISEFSPLSDAQWSYSQLTKWKGFFSYESYFFGVDGASKIVCDKENGQTNIVRVPGVLDEIDGKNPRKFANYAWAQLGDRQYFLATDWLVSDGCNTATSHCCDLVTYTLYECSLEYTSCNPLFIQYADDSCDEPILEANEKDNEINLYNDFDDNPDRILIFTYGENPRCYVEGCQILEAE
jgi:hypothetical protein